MSQQRIFAVLAVLVAATPSAALAQAAAKPAATAAPPTRAGLTAKLESTFKGADANSDGALTTAEIDAVQKHAADQAVAAVTARLADQFAKLDADKNGQLTRAEFLAAAPTARATGAGDPAVKQLDVNKDGKVTLDEYRTPMLAAFDRIDANKDGTLSDEERRAESSRGR